MRNARRRAARRLQRAGFTGEEVVAVDTGSSVKTGNRFDLAATDAALYLWAPKVGLDGRFPYDNLADVQVPNMSGGWQGFLQFSVLGTGDPGPDIPTYAFSDVTLTKHELQDYVLRRSRGRRTRPYYVTWEPSEWGAHIGVIIEEGVPRVVGWVR